MRDHDEYEIFIEIAPYGKTLSVKVRNNTKVEDVLNAIADRFSSDSTSEKRRTILQDLVLLRGNKKTPPTQ